VAQNPAIGYSRHPQSEGTSSVVRIYGERVCCRRGIAVDSSGIQEYAYQMLD
jgi:hypothetical protein